MPHKNILNKTYSSSSISTTLIAFTIHAEMQSPHKSHIASSMQKLTGLHGTSIEVQYFMHLSQL